MWVQVQTLSIYLASAPVFPCRPAPPKLPIYPSRHAPKGAPAPPELAHSFHQDWHPFQCDHYCVMPSGALMPLQSNSCPGYGVASPTHQHACSSHSRASQPVIPGASPAHQCTHSSHNWSLQSTGLGGSPAHHCAHSIHGPVTIGGCTEPTQGPSLECWVLVTWEIGLLGTTECLLQKVTPFKTRKHC